VVVRDLFTDKEKGPRFDWAKVEFAKATKGAGETVAIVLTTREDMTATVGTALSARASLKRPAVVSAAAVVAKKSKA